MKTKKTKRSRISVSATNKLKLWRVSKQLQISVSAVLALILNDYFNANPRKVK